jgi:CRP/FNR family cyclic AMP-dependent transcriptional regulator
MFGHHRETAHKPPHSGLSSFFTMLAKRGRELHFAANTLIIREHDHGDSLFFIVDGTIRVFTTGEDGNQFIIGDYGPGDYVGEMSLETHLRSASVMALTPVVAAMVDRAAVLADIRARPDHALELIFEVTRRARATTDTVKGLALHDVYRRIVDFIESQCGHPAIPAVIQAFPPHEEIAQRIATSEHVVTFILEDLVKDGFLERKGASLIVCRRLPSHW